MYICILFCLLFCIHICILLFALSDFSFVDFPSVLRYCWLDLLTCKNRVPYNLYCVGRDVKHCTIQSNTVPLLILFAASECLCSHLTVIIMPTWMTVCSKGLFESSIQSWLVQSPLVAGLPYSVHWKCWCRLAVRNVVQFTQCDKFCDL